MADFVSLDALSFSSSSPATNAVVLIAALLGAVVLYSLLSFTQRFYRQLRLLSTVPVAPGGNFLLGHVLPMVMCIPQGKGAWDVVTEWLKAQQIVRFRILGTHSVAVSDPLAIKRIWQHKFKIYLKDLELSYCPFLPILGTGLVTADGDLWQKQRLLIGPALRVDILDDIVRIAKVAVDRLCLKLESHRGSGKPVNVEEEFRLLTLQVIGEAILSLAPEDCDRVFPRLYLPVMEEANRRVLHPYRRYLPIPAWFSFRRRMSELNDFLTKLMRDRWNSRQRGEKSEKGDILDRILASVEENGEKWTPAMEKQLCYEIKTFLLAGHETSASMLTWSLFELCKNQVAMDKVRAEAQGVFGEANSQPERSQVDGMEYTLSVLKEALRKYSVVPVVTRKLVVDDELLGHRIPAGTMVAISIAAVHNQWKNYDTFSPERFMPGGEYDQFDESIRPYMFIPFIQGPRNCLGQHLALLEARVVLSRLVSHFKFTIASPDAGKRAPTVIPVGPLGGMDMYIN